MPRAYRVKVPASMILAAPMAEAEGMPSLLILAAWTAATAVGMGAGWDLAQAKQNAFWLGVPLAICQGLVLFRTPKRALAWMGVTCVGCWIAVAVMLALGLPVRSFLIGRGWTTAGDSTIGWAILLLAGIGVPVLSLAQAQLIKQWAKNEGVLFWFGVSTFSFLLIALFGRFMTDAWLPDHWVQGLVEIDQFEPRLWVLGAVWGACTGWAMSKMPEIAFGGD